MLNPWRGTSACEEKMIHSFTLHRRWLVIVECQRTHIYHDRLSQLLSVQVRNNSHQSRRMLLIWSVSTRVLLVSRLFFGVVVFFRFCFSVFVFVFCVCCCVSVLLCFCTFCVFGFWFHLWVGWEIGWGPEGKREV